MGWFLHSQKRDRRRKANRWQQLRYDWDPATTWRAIGILVGAAVLILGSVGWSMARQELLGQAAARIETPDTVEHIHLVDAPAWMDRFVNRQLRQVVATQMVSDRFEHSDLAQAVAALAANPWVQRVDRIQRRARAVQVSATYRRPVAVVQTRRAYYRVDAQAVQLPGLFVYSQLSVLALPVIQGAADAAPGEGRIWPGNQVTAALALLDVLIDQPYAHQIHRIDAGTLDAQGRPRLSIITEHGRVGWGLQPGQGPPIEPDTVAKKRRLAKLYRKWRSIDAGGKKVDIYGPAIFIRNNAEDQGALALQRKIAQSDVRKPF